MLTAQKLEFHDRIARIAAGQGSTRATVFVGQDLTFSYVPRNRRRRAGLAEMVANARHSLSFPLCMALGLASYGLYLYGQWILLGVPNAPESPDLDMAITALATSCITVLLTHVLGLRARALLVPKLLGVAFGMLFFHNFVHAYPAFFDRAFSPIWVGKITSMTEPYSLLFRGVSFSF